MSLDDGPMADAVTGRQQRFRELFAQHADAVHAYARHRVRPDDVEDVVGEVFLVVWRRLDTVRAGEELAWILGVARRVILASRRSATDWAVLQERLHQAPTPAVDDPADVVAERRRVEEVLGQLAEPDREAILLVYWYDLTREQAAAVMGCGTTTFSVRLYRARRRVARMLASRAPTAVTARAVVGGTDVEPAEA